MFYNLNFSRTLNVKVQRPYFFRKKVKSMSSFICQKSEIILVKNRKQLNEILKLALINEEEHDFYMVYYFFIIKP